MLRNCESFDHFESCSCTCRAVCEEPSTTLHTAERKHKFAGPGHAKACRCTIVAQIPNLLEVVSK
jgi:hypothetical protein